MEERVLCKHEVIGSSPIFSTKEESESLGIRFLLFLCLCTAASVYHHPDLVVEHLGLHQLLYG